MLGSIVFRMVPSFQLMQIRIDKVNGVLREQITGIRVVRAFVREPKEAERFAAANADVTETALRAGRLMSAMFPTVLLLINVSSVAVLWIGANFVNEGELQVGSLIAYLSYLIQILFAVVMATFLVSMIPRATVASERIVEVLDTPTSVDRPGQPGHGGPRTRHARVPRRVVRLPGRRVRGAVERLVPRRGRQDDRDHRLDRVGQVDARQPRATPRRCHRPAR